MPVKQFSDLPSNIRSFLTSKSDADVNAQIRADFFLDDDQFNFFIDLIMDIALGNATTLDLPRKLARIPRAEDIDLRKLAIRIATDKLWPMQEYLGGVDILLNRLGARVPEKHSMITQVQSEELDTGLEYGSAEEILGQHQEYSELFITQKPIKDDDDRLKTPTVKNWVADYLHTMGAAGASSLKRSQFLAKSRNTVKLNEAEKENLLNFLVSYDEGKSMYWEVAEEQYLIVRSELPKEERQGIEKKQAEHKLDELIAHYKEVTLNFSKLFDDQAKGLEVETNGDIKHLYDIVWDAIGLNEEKRCISALNYLIEKRALYEMFKIDRRYRGLVSRYIDAHYGPEAKKFWNQDLTATLALSMFWKLLLVEKLRMKEDRAAILSDMWMKKLEHKVSPLYLDLKQGTFLFREIRYENRQFIFV